MDRRNVLGAWRITTDNMQAVYKQVDASPFINLPDQENGRLYDEVLTRFRLQKEVARKFAPHTLPILNQLENLARRHKAGKLSDKAMFAEVKRISIKHGLNQDFVERVKQSTFGSAFRQPQQPGRPSANGFNIRPVKIQPFRLGNQKRPRHKNSSRMALNYLFGGRR